VASRRPLCSQSLPLTLSALHPKSIVNDPAPVPPLLPRRYHDRAGEINATYVKNAKTVRFDLATQQPEFCPELEDIEAKITEMMPETKRS